ncbi:hydrolase, alpha/beta fold family-like protein [Leishmania donovani]|uniref:Hydrolase, alpha/beta fold family-like protein n=2 Tax=Leishmania donovani TaxID=5661 RepID=E9BDD2_LEIDO|nr:hydrolase, alpha/beta fold family-like protein [Leishmania donovani]CBZ33258.1 hydrolase, alpha/beta fold family-like protein [Leishmania donovani]
MMSPEITETDEAENMPRELRGKGKPMPCDKFVRVGRCHSTRKEVIICYRTLGDPSNPCLLLVIGLGGTLLHWPGEFLAELLKNGFYLVLFDNRDSGLSTHFDGYPTPCLPCMIFQSWSPLCGGAPPYTLYDMANDAWCLLTALGIGRAHLLGTSMGGMIVQCMAIEYPKRVCSLTICYSHSSGPYVKPQACRVTLALLDKPASLSLKDVEDYVVRSDCLFRGDYPLDEAHVREVAAANFMRSPPYKSGLLRHVWAVQRASNREPALRRLRGFPVLVVHGRKDLMIPYENGLRLACVLCNAKLVLFPQMGHSIPRPLYVEIAMEVGLQKLRMVNVPL